MKQLVMKLTKCQEQQTKLVARLNVDPLRNVGDYGKAVNEMIQVFVQCLFLRENF